MIIVIIFNQHAEIQTNAGKNQAILLWHGRNRGDTRATESIRSNAFRYVFRCSVLRNDAIARERVEDVLPLVSLLVLIYTVISV